MYDGILGMDWLIENSESIHYADDTLTYKNEQGHEILVQGRNSAPKARLVKASRLIKGAKARTHIYLIKLNKVEKTKDDQDPMWL